MLCYYSNGGIGHTEAYNMPIFLRIFNLRTLVKFKEKENSTEKSHSAGDTTEEGLKNKKMLRGISGFKR
jgi:hypothetical protein